MFFVFLSLKQLKFEEDIPMKKFESKVNYFLTHIIYNVYHCFKHVGSMLVVLELKTWLMNHLKTNDKMCFPLKKYKKIIHLRK